MKQKLINSLIHRIETEFAPQNPVKFIKDLDITYCADLAISIIYLYTRAGRGHEKKIVLMTEIISAIGHGIRNHYKLKRDSAVAAKAGAFILYSFDLLGMVRVTLNKGSNGHATYTVETVNDEMLTDLWETLEIDNIEKLPALTPYDMWETAWHSNGTQMIKTTDLSVLDQLTLETHPLLFESLNRSQSVGWRINEDVYEVYSWALRNKTEAFADIWEMSNPEAKASKIREAKAIGGIAKRLINKTFFHQYTFDFRGRKYVSSAYLHEQGTDAAKGLLLRAIGKPIGQQGFLWLCISIASNWAGDANREDQAKTDKIPLEDRVAWTLDNEEILMSYVENPKVNQDWMKAEKPWQFIAACIELNKLRQWQTAEKIRALMNNEALNEFGYSSQLLGYIDGENAPSKNLVNSVKLHSLWTIPSQDTVSNNIVRCNDYRKGGNPILSRVQSKWIGSARQLQGN